MKHRKTKLSLGLKVVSILSCVAILAVGFANWWIIKVTDAPQQEGSFEVYTVEEKEVKITAEFTNSEIIFGVPSNYSELSSKWLVANNVGTADGQMKTESLAATLKITVTADTGIALNSILDSLTITLANNETLNGVAPESVAVPKIYLNSVSTDNSNLKATYTEGTGATITVSNSELGSSNTVTLTYVIQFGWGSTTAGKNPYVHYNQNSYTADAATEAKTLLTAVNGLSSAKYTITIASKTK